MASIVNGTEMYHDAIRRIHELERLNSALAQEIDRLGPIATAARQWRAGWEQRAAGDYHHLEQWLVDAVDTYEQSTREAG